MPPQPDLTPPALAAGLLPAARSPAQTDTGASLVSQQLSPVSVHLLIAVQLVIDSARFDIASKMCAIAEGLAPHCITAGRCP